MRPPPRDSCWVLLHSDIGGEGHDRLADPK